MENVLVSVCVLAYNSSNTIIDTLESIKKQTYQNIELLISDDCSQDNTVTLCENWINQNNGRFVETRIITSESNTGLAANCNRCYKIAHGEWIKGIAADDILLPDCIQLNVSYCNEHKDTCILFSKLQKFNQSNKAEVIRGSVTPEGVYLNISKNFNDLSAREQYLHLLQDGCFLQAPTSFLKREVLISNPLNEIYKNEEDYPMWLKLTRQGNKINFFDEVTVLYRIGNSLSHRRTDYYSRKHMESCACFFWNEAHEYFKQEGLVSSYNQYRKKLLLYELTEAFTQNKKTWYNTILWLLFRLLVNKLSRFEYDNN